MKTVHSLTLLALAATTLASSAAVMPGTNITVDDDGNYLQNGAPPPDGDGNGANSLASKAFYDSFNPEPGNANSKSSNLKLLQGVIAYWNSADLYDDVPLVTSAADLPVDNGSIGGSGAFTAIAGYDYVVFHFGGGQAAAHGQEQGAGDPDEDGWWSVWYLGGQSKFFGAVPQEGIPFENPESVGGFSSARYFNGRPTPPDDRVPDGGSTIASLGVALLGLSGLRKLIKKA